MCLERASLSWGARVYLLFVCLSLDIEIAFIPWACEERGGGREGGMLAEGVRLWRCLEAISDMFVTLGRDTWMARFVW